LLQGKGLEGNCRALIWTKFMNLLYELTKITEVTLACVQAENRIADIPHRSQML
jgi:hypothetical protein